MEAESGKFCGKYLVKAFAIAESAEEWLGLCAANQYHFVSMASTETTDHFSNEIQALMWIVAEKDPA